MTGYLAGLTGLVVATTVTVVAAYSAPLFAPAVRIADLATPAAPESDSRTARPVGEVRRLFPLGSIGFRAMLGRVVWSGLALAAPSDRFAGGALPGGRPVGAPLIGFVADRFAAAARDLAEHAGAAGAPASGPADPDGGSTVRAPGASATPNPGGARQFPFGTGADGASSGGVTSIPPTARPGEAGRHYPFSTN